MKKQLVTIQEVGEVCNLVSLSGQTIWSSDAVVLSKFLPHRPFLVNALFFFSWYVDVLLMREKFKCRIVISMNFALDFQNFFNCNFVNSKDCVVPVIKVQYQEGRETRGGERLGNIYVPFSFLSDLVLSYRLNFADWNSLSLKLLSPIKPTNLRYFIYFCCNQLEMFGANIAIISHFLYGNHWANILFHFFVLIFLLILSKQTLDQETYELRDERTRLMDHEF